MKEPCIGCDRKRVDKYGYLCDLACGKRSGWLNYQAGIKEVVEWLENHIGYSKMFQGSPFEWQAQKKKWGIE